MFIQGIMYVEPWPTILFSFFFFWGGGSSKTMLNHSSRGFLLLWHSSLCTPQSSGHTRVETGRLHGDHHFRMRKIDGTGGAVTSKSSNSGSPGAARYQASGQGSPLHSQADASRSASEAVEVALGTPTKAAREKMRILIKIQCHWGY